MLGWKSPAGVIGLGFSHRFGRFVIPAVAVGVGGPEGMNLSIGNEARIGSYGRSELRAFTYWTYVTGSRDEWDDTHGTTVSSGGALKVGATIRFGIPQFIAILGAGYAWFLSMPLYEERGPSGAFSVPANEYDPYFEPGFVVRLEIALPF